MQKPIPIQSLECFRSPVAKDSSTDEPVAIFAVPPDDSTPHGLGLNLPQAQRLLAATILLLDPAAERLQHPSRSLHRATCSRRPTCRREVPHECRSGLAD